MLRGRPAPDLDLENALATLDPDLDNLEIPQPQQQRPQGRGLPGMPPERAREDGARSGRRARRAATEDEGVLIDFDDDE